MQMTKQTGIYQIFNTANGKLYIGRTLNLQRRRREHFNKLRKGNHPNGYLQNAWNKYGESAFEFRVLLTTTNHHRLSEFESVFVEDLKPEYNLAAVNRLEHARFQENERARENRRQGQKRRWAAMTDEERQQMGQKISEAQRGQTRSPETLERMSQATQEQWATNPRMTATHLRSLPPAVRYNSAYQQSRADLAQRYRGSGNPMAGRPSAHRRPIERIDPKTGEVQEYPYIAAVSADGFSMKAVHRSLRGKSMASGGFYWSYLN